MSFTTHPSTLHEDYFGDATFAGHENDFGWLALDAVIDNWPGWLPLVNHDHNDGAARNTPRPTSPSLTPSQPAPILLSVAPITEDYVELFELTPSAVQAASPACHAASKGEKRLRPKRLTKALRFWMERRQAPYASLEEKKMVAEALSISVEQVTNFCNNFRKRFVKVGARLTSYRELVSAAQ
jgi:hypothetical protein